MVLMICQEARPACGCWYFATISFHFATATRRPPGSWLESTGQSAATSATSSCAISAAILAAAGEASTAAPDAVLAFRRIRRGASHAGGSHLVALWKGIVARAP